MTDTSKAIDTLNRKTADAPPEETYTPGTLRERARTLIDDIRFEKVIMALIVINAITLGLETSDAAMAAAGPILMMLDRIILAIFVAELLLRFYVRRMGFFKRPWNLFDLFVVGIALMPATGNLSVLRALRILRVLRMISIVPSLRRVVGALVSALPGMGSIILLLGLVFYVFSVMATKLYGSGEGACEAIAGRCAEFAEWFGNIGASAYTLFQVMTLESWSMGIVRPVMDVYPLSWLFFVPFILMTSFTVLNLFIGIIVSAMQGEHEEAAQAERDAIHNETAILHEEVTALRGDIAELKDALKAAGETAGQAGGRTGK
jgi:voltage-gated sodium channel